MLEVTVYDEDPNNKVEFLGKVAIPLLKVRPISSMALVVILIGSVVDPQRRAALVRPQGSQTPPPGQGPNPHGTRSESVVSGWAAGIRRVSKVVFNPFKAAIRTFNPREIKFIPTQSKFKRVNNLRSLRLYIPLSSIGCSKCSFAP